MFKYSLGTHTATKKSLKGLLLLTTSTNCDISTVQSPRICVSACYAPIIQVDRLHELTISFGKNCKFNFAGHLANPVSVYNLLYVTTQIISDITILQLLLLYSGSDLTTWRYWSVTVLDFILSVCNVSAECFVLQPENNKLNN